MDSKGIVNNSGTQSTVTDAAHIEYDLGPNNSDRRHALVVSGAVLLPFDINLSGVSPPGRRCRSARSREST